MPTKLAHVEIPIICTHCQAKQIVHVVFTPGFSQMGYGPQTIRCANCDEHFEVSVPDVITDGPFLKQN